MKIHFPIPRHDRTRFIRLKTSLCKACWACVEACPNSVIGKAELFSHRHAHIDYAEGCRGCSRCVRACPNGAIYSCSPRQASSSLSSEGA